MSWLNPRRPKKTHPWPPRETRANVLWAEGLKRTREFCRDLDRRTVEWAKAQDELIGQMTVAEYRELHDVTGRWL